MKNGLVERETNEPVTRIVAVGGIKMEVDMRHAVKIEHYKVGTKVRILKKSSSYGEDYKTYGGVIVGFDQFEKQPSILIAYLKSSYGDAEIEFLSYNSTTKDVEICAADINFVPFQKATILEVLNSKIVEAEQHLLETKMKKEYFVKNFDEYFDKPE